MPPVMGLIYLLVFLYVVCGAWLGVSTIRGSRSARDSKNPELEQISSPVSAFSLMILFLGLANIIYSRSLLGAGYSYPLDPYIFLAASAILLIVGYRIYKDRSIESKLMGGALMLVSTVLLYFFAYPRLRQDNVLFDFDFYYSTSSGPLFCQFDIEAVSLSLTTLCSVLYVLPQIKKGSRRLTVGAALALGAIMFGCGLMYFNFAATSNLIMTMSPADQTTISIWTIAFGVLTLGISGIIILVSALLSLVFLYRMRKSTIMPPPATPPPARPQSRARKPPASPTMIRCQRCGHNNPANFSYCGKCGTPLREEETQFYG